MPNVFLNVPFDRRYKNLFDALVFAVVACGFEPRCALEGDERAESRRERILDLIEESEYCIHDLSRTQLDRTHRLPRFNMPFELGLFLGAKRFGGAAHRRKACLILDSDRYRYQKFCSDIAGKDVCAHANDVFEAIRAVRDWLQTKRPGSHLLGPERIAALFVAFREELPRLCRRGNLALKHVTFLDFRRLVHAMLDDAATR